MFKLSKILFLSVLFSTTAQADSSVLHFINHKSMVIGTGVTILNYIGTPYIIKPFFDRCVTLGKDQEKEANQKNASEVAKRIGAAIKLIKERLNELHNDCPTAVACLSDYQSPIGIFKYKDKFAIVLSGGEMDVLFDLRFGKKPIQKKIIDFLIGHEYTHFRNNDMHHRSLSQGIRPLIFGATWRKSRLHGNNKTTSLIASLGASYLHAGLCSQYSKFHELRADRQASLNPEILEAGADWLEKDWTPCENTINERSLDILYAKYSIPFSRETTFAIFQLFSTHPKTTTRIKLLRAQAAQIRATQKLKSAQTKKRQAL